ncbi:3-keto-5-aminohexanoate cleavage protein [Mesorhizobium sp. B2-9-1]|uniref:3-keto-5-aminohexanoate cleavage protein n=1 Tax=unclassified Mesorhizobium TaxID=325217 RepID=UPI00112877D7|nr:MULTISPECIES: 3-keto-5-aminohexanoate cleavage protein [unclassified Mesorhizobium]TPI48356.1 3-keto-5-aminohexanoate cleavage protein [Mesorhizobium sp. B2-9-1]TPO12751.1 3-keto-5-aminohexanoate cleavage protein [Mesorhizobium sp. B1-1-5]
MQSQPSNRAVAIAVAPNGGRRTRADHPALPMTQTELARAAAECLEAGAAMIHLHVRDRHGRHVLDPDAYRAATAAVRRCVGDALVVQITSEALGLYEPERQMKVVRQTRPEAVSLALRELVPDRHAEAAFATFLAWLRHEHVLPQIILYDPDEALYLFDLHRRGLIPWDDIPVLFVLGRYTASQQSAPTDLLPFLSPHVPRFRSFMVCAFGRDEAACVCAGALFGGDVRVGFENNLLLPDGSIAASNAVLVDTVAQRLRGFGRPIHTGASLRNSWQR